MRFLLVLFTSVSLFAAPCVYDSTSSEPSALAGLVGVMTPR
ncbi:hypothetical protein J2X76_005393 [Neorhizobium sp. 2083]|nr:hypothetical protein [Neorhizobium sp. 2083]